MAIELIERANSRAQPTPEIMLTGGVIKDIASTEIEPHQCPDASNVYFHKYGLTSRPGLFLLESAGLPLGSGESIVGMFQYTTSAQFRYFVVLTTSGIYRVDTSGSTWIDINQGVSPITIDCVATDFATGCFFPKSDGSDMYIITNRQNDIIKVESTKITGSPPYVENLTCPYKAKFVLPYMDYLLLVNCEVSGTSIPQRIIWSDIGDPEEYNTGKTGQYDIVSGGTEIKAAVLMKSVVYLYLESGIAGFQWIGGMDVFRWGMAVPEVGVAAGRSVGDLGEFHIFLGWDNVYMFDGTQRLQKLSEGKVGNELIETINWEYVDRAFHIVDKKFGLYSLFVPTGTDEWPRTRWIYDLDTGGWTKYDYNIDFTCAAQYKAFEGMAWQDFEEGLAWEDLPHGFRWSDRAASQEAPRMAMGSGSGNVYFESMLALRDDETTITSTGDTKDWQIGDNTRFVKFDFEGVGSSVDVLYSTDEGETWTELETVTLDDSTHQRYEVHLNVLAERLRFRFSNSAAYGWFNIRKFRLWVIPRT